MRGFDLGHEDQSLEHAHTLAASNAILDHMVSKLASLPQPARRWLRRGLLILVVLSAVGALGLAVSWSFMSRDADSFLTMFALRVPKTITKVLDQSGNVIGIFAEEHRVVIPYGDIPKAFVNALVATEDTDFWDHSCLLYTSDAADE